MAKINPEIKEMEQAKLVANVFGAISYDNLHTLDEICEARGLKIKDAKKTVQNLIKDRALYEKSTGVYYAH